MLVMGHTLCGAIKGAIDGVKLGNLTGLLAKIRPAVEAVGLTWYGWHGFRRGIASNLYELGANDKIVQRILRHANPHVTKERYIKAFDPAVLDAMHKEFGGRLSFKLLRFLLVGFAIALIILKIWILRF